MPEKIDFTPHNPLYQRKSAIIARLEAALDPKRQAELLLELGEAAKSDDRLSNKQAMELSCALNRSGLLSYNASICRASLTPAEIDGVRCTVEMDGKLQHLAIITLSRFAEGTLSIHEQYEWLKSLFNRAHQAG